MFQCLSAGALGVRVDYEEEVELAAHFAFDGVCTNIQYLRENGPETVVQMLEERNLRPGGWALPVPLQGDEDAFNEALDSLAEVADLCSRAADLRAFTWVSPASDQLPYQEHLDLVRRRVSRVAKVLADYDVRLGLEFIGTPSLRRGRKYEFIHDMAAMLELCRSIESGNVGLLLDSWHLYTSGGSMDEVLSLKDEDVVLVHVNDAPAGVPIEKHQDNVRELPGATGVIDCRRFLQCLRQVGYAGPVVVEPFCERLKALSPQQAVEEAKRALDAVWPQ